jgi:acyl-coenzyme A thioesterase PaaI-like protein
MSRHELFSELTSVEARAASSGRASMARQLRRLAQSATAIDDATAGRIALALQAALPNGAPDSRFTSDGVYPIGSHPVFGAENVVAPPLTLSIDPVTRSVVARGSFGPIHEGLPGVVFGGSIASTFDAVLGVAAATVGYPVIAASISVRYRRPTPTNQPIEFVGSVVAADDRVIVAEATSEVRGDITATATATFYRVDPDICVTS